MFCSMFLCMSNVKHLSHESPHPLTNQPTHSIAACPATTAHPSAAPLRLGRTLAVLAAVALLEVLGVAAWMRWWGCWNGF